MSENAGFEVRGILVPRRARVSRLALLLPVVALLAFAWAGASGRGANQATAATTGSATPEPVAVVASSGPVVPSASPHVARVSTTEVPRMVVGLWVQLLNQVQVHKLRRDDSVAIVGWYATTAITDCPPLAEVYRDGATPGVEGDTDSYAFCQRKGVLYAAPPIIAFTPPQTGGVALVRATVAITVVMPPELEKIGTDPVQVVVVGRFVERNDPCGAATDCAPTFVIDHVAWTDPT